MLYALRAAGKPWPAVQAPATNSAAAAATQRQMQIVMAAQQLQQQHLWLIYHQMEVC
jgi:hypothetical protein